MGVSKGNLSEEYVVIRPFQAGDEIAFRQLNEEWITRYFRLEEKDHHARPSARDP